MAILRDAAKRPLLRIRTCYVALRHSGARTDDQMWPSSLLADIAMRRLQSSGFKFPFRHLKYQDAGHLILLPFGPRTTRVIGFKAEGFGGMLYSQGGTPKADAEAGTDAWRQMLLFLEAAIKQRR